MMVTCFFMAAVLLASTAASPLLEIPVPPSQLSGEISNIRLLVPLPIDDESPRPRRPPRAPPVLSIPWKPAAEYPDYSYEYSDRKDEGQKLGLTRGEPKNVKNRVENPEKLDKTPKQRVRDVDAHNSLNGWIESLDNTWIHDIDRNQIYELNDKLRDAISKDVSEEKFADKIAESNKEKVVDKQTNNKNDESFERYGEEVKNWLHQFYASLMKQSREKRKPNIKINLNQDGNELDSFGGKIKDKDDLKAWLQKLDESLHFSDNEDNLQYAFVGQNLPQGTEEQDEDSNKNVAIDRSLLTDGVLSNILSDALQSDSEEYRPETTWTPETKALKDGVFSNIPAEAFELDSEEYSPKTVKKDLSTTPLLKVLSDQSLCGDEPGEIGGTCGVCCAIRQLVEELNLQEKNDKEKGFTGRAEPTEPVNIFSPTTKIPLDSILVFPDDNRVNIFEPAEKLVEIFKAHEEEDTKPVKPLDFEAMLSGLAPEELHIDKFGTGESSPVQKQNLHVVPFNTEPMKLLTLDRAQKDRPDPVVIPAGSGPVPDGVIPIILAVVPSRRDWHVLVPPEGTPDAER